MPAITLRCVAIQLTIYAMKSGSAQLVIGNLSIRQLGIGELVDLAILKHLVIGCDPSTCVIHCEALFLKLFLMEIFIIC
jgi:hypothetical protein